MISIMRFVALVQWYLARLRQFRAEGLNVFAPDIDEDDSSSGSSDERKLAEGRVLVWWNSGNGRFNSKNVYGLGILFRSIGSTYIMYFYSW
jgi:hypothetical protein